MCAIITITRVGEKRFRIFGGGGGVSGEFLIRDIGSERIVWRLDVLNRSFLFIFNSSKALYEFDALLNMDQLTHKTFLLTKVVQEPQAKNKM